MNIKNKQPSQLTTIVVEHRLPKVCKIWADNYYIRQDLWLPPLTRVLGVHLHKDQPWLTTLEVDGPKVNLKRLVLFGRGQPGCGWWEKVEYVGTVVHKRHGLFHVWLEPTAAAEALIYPSEKPVTADDDPDKPTEADIAELMGKGL